MFYYIFVIFKLLKETQTIDIYLLFSTIEIKAHIFLNENVLWKQSNFSLM